MSTRIKRNAARQAEMAQRRAEQLSRTAGFTEVEGKVSGALKAQFFLRHPGQPLPPPPGAVKSFKASLKPPASVNRRTGKPHEHKREIARRTKRNEA